MNVREIPRTGLRSVEWEFSQSTYAAVLADVPAALFSHWAQTAHSEFPGIPRDAFFYTQAAEGLMMFFDCASAAGTRCALPSRAADSVWHAWTRMDAAGLERFCIRHFGRTIPHVERAHMKGGDMGRALAVCLVHARRRASRPAAGCHVPRLFSLDLQLGMPRGFGYRVIDGLVACSVLDELGNPDDEVSFPSELTPHALLRAGLVCQSEYDEAAGLGQVGALRSGTADSASGDGDASCGASACGAGDCSS